MPSTGLLADDPRVDFVKYREAFEDWMVEVRQRGQLRRASSIQVYDHMWSSLSRWAVGNGVRLDELDVQHLSTYLESRGGLDDLSARYAFRLVRLVDRVLAERERIHGGPPNHAAADVLQLRPDLRYANAIDRDPLPSFLPASEAKVLVTYLSTVRRGGAKRDQSWQEVRNRSAVGLMLGAGLTPGEVRSLELADVISESGKGRQIPWKLRVGAEGNGPERETPVAQWAGQLLLYWLLVRVEQEIPGTMLFPSTKGTGKAWGKVAQYNAAKEVMKSAGIDAAEGGSFRLRHTFALRQLKRGSTPAEVAQWLGVSEPAVMDRYRRVIMAPIYLA